MDLEKGGFDMGQLGIPEIDQPVGQDPQGPTMTESMVKRPLEMSTADLTQSMMVWILSYLCLKYFCLTFIL